MANDFIITVDDFTAPSASDPNQCRIFGVLRGVTGQPLRDASIHILNQFIPQIVTDPGAEIAVLGERVVLETDSAGFVEFDLYRNAEVDILIPSQHPNPYSSGQSDPFFSIVVPDQASLNLVDLLYPVQDSLEFTDTSPIVLVIGTLQDLTVKLLLTNGFEAEDLTGIDFSSSDDSLVKVVKKNATTISVERLAAGQAFITADIDLEKLQFTRQPKKGLKLIVNATEDPAGFEVN